MAKKDKKKKVEEEKKEEEVPVEVAPPEPEPEPEEVQFTETSYTSASFESLPPIIEEHKPKPEKRKRRKHKEESTIKVVESEVFNWSEESLPPIVDSEIKIGEAGKLGSEADEAKPKKATKKKGKKDEKKEEIPDFEKPPNWKKMNSKERDKWLVERIEEWRAEVEAQKQAALAGIKEKRAAEARVRAEEVCREYEEQEVRHDLLQKICTLFERFEKQRIDYENDKQEKAEWAQFLRCDGLPDPRIVTQMATYLHRWKERGIYDADELDNKCKEALPMLQMLEEIVANSNFYTKQQAENYNEARLALRAQMAHTIEFASYSLLRDIQRNLTMESVRLSTYQRQFNSLKLTLWCAVVQPTKLPEPVHHFPSPTELAFPALKVAVILPASINTTAMCVRASRSLIDLLSESCKTFQLPIEFPNKDDNLINFITKEHEEVQAMKKQQEEQRHDFFKACHHRTRELEAYFKANPFAKNDKLREELDELYLKDAPFMPYPRTVISDRNHNAYLKYLRHCNIRTKTGEVNLRKYRICGGVLNMDLLTLPPQPKQMRYELQLTTLPLPKQLKSSDFMVRYREPKPHPADEERTFEEIEAEKTTVREEYEKLASISIVLPPELLWVEDPVICQWQAPRRQWTSNYINDYHFKMGNMEQDVPPTVRFRTGVLWPIGIATLRYSNMPYHEWDMRPDPYSNGVLIVVTGAAVTVTLLCIGSKVVIKKLANASTPALEEHLKKKYTVKRLCQVMRDASCDFFPDFDAHNHVAGSCPKEWIVERHLYHAMAFLSRAYNFHWSRWNATADFREIVIQLREAVDKKREYKYQLLCANPERTFILKCNESVEEEDFNMEHMQGMKFYPDLFSLNLDYGSITARREPFVLEYKAVETVFNVLLELKLCSFS